MSSIPAFIRETAGGVTLALKVQPRASANEVGELSGEELRVKVTAPPVDAAANEAVLRLVAEVAGCPRSRIELLRGGTSRHKVLKLHGLTAAAVLQALESGAGK